MAKLGEPDVFSQRLDTPSPSRQLYKQSCGARPTSRPTWKQFHGPKYYKRPPPSSTPTSKLPCVRLWKKIQSAPICLVTVRHYIANHSVPLLFSWGDLLWRILFPYYIILYYIMRIPICHPFRGSAA